MKKNFTMRDFEEGLMLAGKVPPANESDRRKLKKLKEYEDSVKEQIEFNNKFPMFSEPKNLYVKLRK